MVICGKWGQLFFPYKTVTPLLKDTIQLKRACFPVLKIFETDERWNTKYVIYSLVLAREHASQQELRVCVQHGKNGMRFHFGLFEVNGAVQQCENVSSSKRQVRISWPNILQWTPLSLQGFLVLVIQSFQSSSWNSQSTCFYFCSFIHRPKCNSRGMSTRRNIPVIVPTKVNLNQWPRAASTQSKEVGSNSRPVSSSTSLWTPSWRVCKESVLFWASGPWDIFALNVQGFFSFFFLFFLFLSKAKFFCQITQACFPSPENRSISGDRHHEAALSWRNKHGAGGKNNKKLRHHLWVTPTMLFKRETE